VFEERFGAGEHKGSSSIASDAGCVFCFVMTLGLVAVLSQAGKLYTASAIWLVLGVSVWTAVLVGRIILVCQWMDREVKRIRIETNTTDEAYAKVLAAQGKQLRLPKFFESRTHFLGLPLFAMAWGAATPIGTARGLSVVGSRLETSPSARSSHAVVLRLLPLR
jgi:hypothetical protein